MIPMDFPAFFHLHFFFFFPDFIAVIFFLMYSRPFCLRSAVLYSPFRAFCFMPHAKYYSYSAQGITASAGLVRSALTKRCRWRGKWFVVG